MYLMALVVLLGLLWGVGCIYMHSVNSPLDARSHPGLQELQGPVERPKASRKHASESGWGAVAIPKQVLRQTLKGE